MVFETEDRAAKFNAGIAKLERIGELRKGCHDSRLFRNYNQWFACLQGIRAEINSKLTRKDNEKKKLKAEIDTANRYEKIIRLCLENKKETMISIEGKECKVADLDIYDMLYEYELWLGDIEEKYKFGMPDEDSAYDALR